jgi:hypothetical protein
MNSFGMKRYGWKSWSRRLLAVLAASIIMIFVLHVGAQLVSRAVGLENRVVTDIAARLSIDSELSVPTWLTAFIGFIGALLTYLIGRAATSIGGKTAWYGLALMMTVVSLDEVAALHELLLQGLHILAQFGEAQTWLANAWLLILPFVALAAWAAGRFIRRHIPRQTLRRISIAAGIYVAGAVVVEYLSIPADKSMLPYLLGLAVFEEALEFLGLWLFVRASLLHISEYQPKLRQKIEAVLSI